MTRTEYEMATHDWRERGCYHSAMRSAAGNTERGCQHYGGLDQHYSNQPANQHEHGDAVCLYKVCTLTRLRSERRAQSCGDESATIGNYFHVCIAQRHLRYDIAFALASPRGILAFAVNAQKWTKAANESCLSPPRFSRRGN